MIHAPRPVVWTPPPLVVTASDETAVARARRWAHDLKLPFVAPGEEVDTPLLLVQTHTRLELRDRRRNEAVCVRVAPADLGRARINRRQPLARALGNAGVVVDATAGFGQDTILMICLGYQVIALERHPVVAALLRDGIDRAVRDGLMTEEQIEVTHADARLALPGITPAPDVIYLDPMFPPRRKKTAAVRKELRLLRELTGDGDDTAELLAISRARAARVVVKRPIDAPPLLPPNASHRGRLVRYDVYRNFD